MPEIIHSNINDNLNLKTIQQLAHYVEHHERVVDRNLKNYQGRSAIWQRHLGNKLPDWAAHHIVLTEQLKQAVKQYEAQTMRPIPKQVKQILIRNEEIENQLTHRIHQAKFVQAAFNRPYSELETIQQLAEYAKRSEKKVNKKLKSSKMRQRHVKAKELPKCVAHHIALTAQLQQAVKHYEANHSQPIPNKIKQILVRNESLNVQLNKCIPYSKFLECFQQAIRAKSFIDRSHPSTTPLEKSTFEWHLNLALLMDVYRKTKDENVKKQISFLAANYLAKSAHLSFSNLPQDVQQKMEEISQLGLFQNPGTYHREARTFEYFILEEVQQQLATKALQGGQFLLTDTTDAGPLLPTKFSVLNTHAPDEAQLVQDWQQGIAAHITEHFQQANNVETGYNQHLEVPLLVDLTPFLKDEIVTESQAEKNQTFEEKFKHYEALMDQAIHQAIQEIKRQTPSICQTPEDEQRLHMFIRVQLVSICQTNLKGANILQPLPLFSNPEYFENRFVENQSLFGQTFNNPKEFIYQMSDTKNIYVSGKLENFINHTGLRLGGVRGRELMFNFMGLNKFLNLASENLSGTGEMVDYAPIGKNALYFANPKDILATNIFTQWKSQLTSSPHDSYQVILGQSTLQLVAGLIEKIDEAKWASINQNPEMRQLVQTSFYRLLQHLATAKNRQEDFNKFTQAIELAHCEIATLLVLTTPFKQSDFQQIYKDQLTLIPQELQGLVTTGIAKSAMNIFAGINAAVKADRPHMERVYTPGSYFEERHFIGSNRTTNEVLNDPAIQQIDLYIGEFNHNIHIHSQHNHYEASNLEEEIQALLDKKENTKHLTIAVDGTIDYVNSKKHELLLKRFSKEIQEGKLNFIFFHSGQKFDMLGMDNYYGAPFYMINNGAKQWKAFDHLVSDEIYQTDPLSQQWFCLANQCAFTHMETYRQQIFNNTRQVLDQVPDYLKPGNNPHVKVCTVDRSMEASFIDIKLLGDKVLKKEVYALFFKKLEEHNIKAHTRGSFGFYHLNLNDIPSEDNQALLNIRINPGLNSQEVKILVEFLNDLANYVQNS